MSNVLINKFKTIDDSRVRLKNILEDKGIEPTSTSLPGLVEDVSRLQGTTIEAEWTGVEIEEMPTDYYVPEIDFNAIYEADTDKDNYTNVVMYIIDCTDHSFSLPKNTFQSFQKYKFSDTNVLTNPATGTQSPVHDWDTTKDIIGPSGRKYRWVMGYSNTANLGVDYQGFYMLLDAIIAFKGSYGTFSVREGNSLPRYIEIKENVSVITVAAGDSGINNTLRTVICNAPTAHLSDSVFRGCLMLYVCKWNSVSNTSTAYVFNGCTGLRWVYIKENAHISDGAFYGTHDCFIQVDKLTGQLGSTSSYADIWPLTNTNNLRIKIGQVTNIYNLSIHKYARGSSYYDSGINYLDIDLITGGTIYSNLNENYGLKTRYREINNCTLNRYCFRCNNDMYPEIKLTGKCTFQQGDAYSQTFEMNGSLKKIDMSEATINNLYHSAFRFAPNLETLYLPKGLTTLHAFMIDNTKIKTLSIPDSVITADSNCFRGADQLESIYIGQAFTVISAYMFAGLANIKHISLPDSVTTIDTAAFSNTSSLQEIVLPANVKRIGIRAFYHSGINSITITGTEVAINNRAFAYCNNLKTIDLSNVTQIDDYAFERTNMDKLIIPSNGLTFTADAFVNTAAKSIVFAEGFEPTQDINISYSSITNNSVLDLLYSLPDLTESTARTLTIGATCDIPLTTAGYTYYDTIKSKKITVNDDGLVWDDNGSITVAAYVASKNWTIV